MREYDLDVYIPEIQGRVGNLYRVAATNSDTNGTDFILWKREDYLSETLNCTSLDSSSHAGSHCQRMSLLRGVRSSLSGPVSLPFMC